MERLLITAEEAAEALQVGRTRVYELIAAGEITSVKIGHLRRIPVEAVREYAARLVEEALVPHRDRRRAAVCAVPVRHRARDAPR